MVEANVFSAVDSNIRYNDAISISPPITCNPTGKPGDHLNLLTSSGITMNHPSMST